MATIRKTILVLVVVCGLMTMALCGCNRARTASVRMERPGPIANEETLFPASAMTLTSPAFATGGAIPDRYTCDGPNFSPPLGVSGVPGKTQALVLIVDDLDAPDGDWTHWLVWNIPPDTTRLAENKLPGDALQGTNDFRQQKYGGPCPPSGTHRYRFKLYALNSPVNLAEGAQQKALEKTMQGHILGRAELIGTYSRSSR